MQGYQKYKDDDEGHWYYPLCDMSKWPGQNDQTGFDKFQDQYYNDHSYDHRYLKYFPAPPLPVASDVPPELLRDIAVERLRPPDPELDWNPKRIGNQGTLVNLDTWFWLNNAPESVVVRAEALGSWATVTATFGGMDITAPGEAPLSCAGPGTPYVSGSHTTTCALAFSRASVALGSETTPVTVTTRWTGTWAANGFDRGLVTPQPAPVTAIQDIRVDEVQTLVTGTG